MMHMKRRITSQLLSSILANAIYSMINFPIMMVNTMLAPIGFLLVIFFVSHGKLLNVAIMGALIMTMVSSGVSLQGDLSHLKNDIKLQEMLVSSPLRMRTYILGMAMSELVFSLPNIVILIVLTVLFVKATLLDFVYVALALSMSLIFSTSLGFFFSTISRDIVESWAFSGLVSIVLSTLPPVYYPITYIPMPFRYLAYLSPTTYAAMLIQNSIGAISLSQTLVIASWIILVIASIAFLVLALKRSKWRE